VRVPSSAALAAFRAARDFLAPGGARVVLLTVPAARAAIAEGTPSRGEELTGRCPAPRIDYPERPDVPARSCSWRDAWEACAGSGLRTLAHAAPPANDNPDDLAVELVLTITRGPARIRVRLPSLT
jgi:hypothetical protein